METKSMQTIRRTVLVLGLLSLLPLFSQTPKAAPGILAQVTDPQIGFNDYATEYNRLHNMVNILNDRDCQCVVICGDLAHDTSKKEHVADLKKELARLQKPCFLVRGNHDGARFFHDNFGPSYYAADLPFPGYRLVVVDTNLWTPEVLPEAAKMEAMLLEELKNAKAAGKKVIMAGHCPIFYKHFDEKKDYNNLTMEKRQWLGQLFQEYPVVAYLAGHTHTAFTWLWHGVLLSNCETTSVAFDQINYGFRRFVFEDGAIRFNTVLVPTTVGAKK